MRKVHSKVAHIHRGQTLFITLTLITLILSLTEVTGEENPFHGLNVGANAEPFCNGQYPHIEHLHWHVLEQVQTDMQY